jgi:hypothetical protein
VSILDLESSELLRQKEVLAVEVERQKEDAEDKVWKSRAMRNRK